MKVGRVVTTGSTIPASTQNVFQQPFLQQLKSASYCTFMKRTPQNLKNLQVCITLEKGGLPQE